MLNKKRKKKTGILLMLIVCFCAISAVCWYTYDQKQKEYIAQQEKIEKEISDFCNNVKALFNEEKTSIRNSFTQDTLDEYKSKVDALSKNTLSDVQIKTLKEQKELLNDAQEMLTIKTDTSSLFDNDHIVKTKVDISSIENDLKKIDTSYHAFITFIEDEIKEAKKQQATQKEISSLLQKEIKNIRPQDLKSAEDKIHALNNKKLKQKLLSDIQTIKLEKEKQVKLEEQKKKEQQKIEQKRKEEQQKKEEVKQEKPGNDTTSIPPKPTSQVLLNVPYFSQYSAGAEMGCEATSLYMALRYKGYASQYTLKDFIKQMPLSKDNNPNNGFSGDPFKWQNNIYQSIYPSPLAVWGSQYGNVSNISGSSIQTVKQEIKNGNPVVVYVTMQYAAAEYGTYHWGTGIDNAHVVTLDGYDDTRYHVCDPAAGAQWINASVFETSYNFTQYAVVVR